jgi:hypothetical protein
VLLRDGPLTFREYLTHEELPLALVFREVLAFLAGRTDAVLFGAQAVNAYCETERMTQDVDVLATDAAGLAEAMRAHLGERLRVAVCVREIVAGDGFRLYQLRKPRPRQLVDLRRVDALPPSREMEGVQVLAPAQLVAMKVQSLVARRNRPKGDTDRADLRRLLLAFPELPRPDGSVAACLGVGPRSEDSLATWLELIAQPLEADEDEGY